MDDRDGYKNPEKNPGEDRPSSNSSPSYPSYPATNHPEDQLGFGSRAASGPWDRLNEQATERLPYGAYPGLVGPVVLSIQVGPAITRSLKAVLRNWKVWVLVAAVIVFGSITLDLVYTAQNPRSIDAPDDSLLSSLPGMAVNGLIFLAVPFTLHAANLSVMNQKITWGEVLRPFAYLRVYGATIVAGLLQVGIGLVAFLLIAGGAFSSGNIGLILIGVVVGLITGVLVAPFFMFLDVFSSYPGSSFSTAWKASLAVGRRYYGGLLLYAIVGGIVVGIVSVLTLGLIGVGLSAVLKADIARQVAGYGGQAV